MVESETFTFVAYWWRHPGIEDSKFSGRVRSELMDYYIRWRS